MFRFLNKKIHKLLLWTAYSVAVFGFILCSNHLVPNHHTGGFLGGISSEVSKESHSKDLNGCTDNYIYSYGGRGCVSGDFSISFDRTSFVDNFVLQNQNTYFSNTFQVKSPSTVSIHILHNVLQV